jgi:hypothetical protein
LSKKIKDLKTSEEMEKKEGLYINTALKEKNFAAGNNFETFS